jgi:hypothetical protein
MTRQAKQYGFDGLAGCVARWRSRATGTLVGLYHGEQSGIECDPELPWVTVCEEHHTLVSHPTLVDGRRTRDPREFCDDCRALDKRS